MKIDIFGGQWEETPAEVFESSIHRALKEHAERVAIEADEEIAKRDKWIEELIKAAT